MIDIRPLVQEILEEGYLLSLATYDTGGIWVSDVIYVYDDSFTLYWISKETSRHSCAILVHPQVAGTITLNINAKEPDKGIQIQGIAQKIKGDVLALAIKHRLKRGKNPPKKTGEILDTGESWYCLKPTIIDLIYHPLFGFEKRKLTMEIIP